MNAAIGHKVGNARQVLIPMPLSEGDLRRAITDTKELGRALVLRKLDRLGWVQVTDFRFVTSEHRRIMSYDGRELLVFVAFISCRAVYAESLA